MLNIKKIFALNIVAFAMLTCALFFHAHQQKPAHYEECLSTTSTFKSNDFSIKNILSLKFR